MEKRYTYKEFKHVLAGEVRKIIDEGADIEIHNVVKNNSL